MSLRKQELMCNNTTKKVLTGYCRFNDLIFLDFKLTCNSLKMKSTLQNCFKQEIKPEFVKFYLSFYHSNYNYLVNVNKKFLTIIQFKKKKNCEKSLIYTLIQS